MCWRTGFSLSPLPAAMSPRGCSPRTPRQRGGLLHSGAVVLAHRFFSIATSCRHATRGYSPRNPRQRAVTRQPSGHPRAGALPLDPRAASHILVSADRFRFIHQFSDALTECIGSQRHRRPLCLRPGASLRSFAPPADLQAVTARRMRGLQ